MRSKLLEAFRARWFSARTMEEARAPAAELCLILRALAVDRDMLPMPHDYVLRRLLHTILHGDPDLVSSRRSAAASHCEHARQVRILPLPRLSSQPISPLALGKVRVAAVDRCRGNAGLTRSATGGAALQAAVLMADVMLGAVLDGTDENQQRNVGDSPAAHADEDFEGAALVILVRTPSNYVISVTCRQPCVCVSMSQGAELVLSGVRDGGCRASNAVGR